MADDPRIIVNEIDKSSFVVATNPETAAFNLITRKGPFQYPVLCFTQDQYIAWFGEPTPEIFGGYEAYQFLAVSPAWIISSIGSGFKYAGVDVMTSEVRSFGSSTGRIPESFNLASLSSQIIFEGTTPILGDGINKTFTGITLPIPSGATFKPSTQPTDFQIYVNDVLVPITSISATSGTQSIISVQLAASGSTVNDTTGTVSLKFLGTAGTPASYLAPNVLSGNVSLAGPKPKAFNLNIDGNLITNLSLGNSATNTITSILSAINSALASAGLGSLASNSSNQILITGTIGDPVFGKIQITSPTDVVTYDNAIPTVFDAAFIGGTIVQTTNSTAPATGSYVPKNGQKLKFKFVVTQDLSGDVAFSLFAKSPYNDDDFDYGVDVRYIKDRIYTVTLYQNLPSLGYSQVTSAPYTISLDKVKDSTGRSIYIFDVLTKDNPYLIPVVNPAYVGIADLAGFGPEIIRLTGGNRGSAPANSDIFAAWQVFRKGQRFPVKTFVDVYGNSASTLNTLIRSFQRYAFGITCVPLGYNALNAIAFRQALNLNTDALALYTNWQLIEDVFTGSSGVFVSGMGKVAIKYARMSEIFDADSPAGIDENGTGGLLNEGFSILDMDQSYEPDELTLLDDNQINPIIKDGANGIVIKGDKTLQVATSDTSFIMHRRLFNYIISNIVEKVLPRQEFRLNDNTHQDKMKALCEQIINPVLVAGWLREAEVVCSDKNNTDEVKAQRLFVIDIFLKVTSNSQRIRLNVIRVSQTTSIATLIPA